MEEKKLDINSIIGFILIFGILVYMMYQNTPTQEEIDAQKQAEQEQVEAEQKEVQSKESKDTQKGTPNDFYGFQKHKDALLMEHSS